MAGEEEEVIEVLPSLLCRLLAEKVHPQSGNDGPARTPAASPMHSAKRPTALRAHRE